MRTHGTPLRGLMSAPRSPLFQGKFGRMFRSLSPATYGDTDEQSESNLETLALAMKSDADAPKDGKDEEESGIPALYTYFGQFIDHDLTFDPASSLQKQNDPSALTDFRTPAFDLDNVYGRGPDDQPYMYRDNGEFVFGKPLRNGHSTARDLPRFVDSVNPTRGRALIGDPRNDENVIVSQLHGLFLRFHNRLLRETGKPFEEVQRLLRFHYQYVILNDFLPRIVHPDVLDELRTHRRFDRRKLEFYSFRNDPFMPVEFSAAAYRFGHSMVRPGYRLNDQKLLAIFPDLAGFRPVDPDAAMDWGRFIDIDIRSANEDQPGVKEKRLQFAYRIDTSLAEPLANLPESVVSGPPLALAERNLKRGYRLGLPSGQAVAKYMGSTPLKDSEIRIGKAVDEPEKPLPSILAIPGADRGVFAGNCPLWTYILAEAMHYPEKHSIPVAEPAQVTTPRLGPVGGRIVAEVFLGLMFGDRNSLLALDPNWEPVAGPEYGLKDFVKYALGE